ncbi:MAG TPA: HAD-IIA family hydrolase [Thermoanaerobaculia bacterium]
MLLDIFGVLIDARGTLPGAVELLAEIKRRGTPYALVTNDASRTVTTYARHLSALGLFVDPAHLVTSGSLIPNYFASRALQGSRVVVLGTPDSAEYVRAGGGHVVPLTPGVALDVLAVCDDAGAEFLAPVEWALSAVVRALEANRRPVLLLPNPDLVYPKGAGELGLTAGAIALMIEGALAQRFPREQLVFDRLGKPETHLFDEAARRLGLRPERLVMIGDQLSTDIVGAIAAGCDAALLLGGSAWDATSDVTPTWLLQTLWP